MNFDMLKNGVPIPYRLARKKAHMPNYSRRRRGYYGTVEPTRASNVSGQMIIAFACLVILACLMLIIVNTWSFPVLPEVKIRSRLN